MPKYSQNELLKKDQTNFEGWIQMKNKKKSSSFVVTNFLYKNLSFHPVSIILKCFGRRTIYDTLKRKFSFLKGCPRSHDIYGRIKLFSKLS